MDSQATPSRSRRTTNQYDSPVLRMPAQFPQTPQSVQPNTTREESPKFRTTSPIASLAVRSGTATSKQDQNTGPVIPITVLDPASQRLYAFAVFGLLQAWKIYDLGRLFNAEDDTISELWFILKWLFIDGVFFSSLPSLRIPWLIFNSHATITMIVVSGVISIFISLQYYVEFYNRELSLSERRVKINDIVFNSSHILGKHTLHFLPEGSAQINPEHDRYCIDGKNSHITIPIRINSTFPSLIQLSRNDFESPDIHLINITQKEVKKLIKASAKGSDPKVHDLQFVVNMPGLYRLSRVVDISNLIVRISKAEALVVECPTASLHVSGLPHDFSNKCKGDLSDMALQVRGLPPLKVKYSRTINKDEKGVVIQSITPENYKSPLLRSSTSDGQIVLARPNDAMTWAQPQTISISLNESLAIAGSWTYTVDEVHDALGNIIRFPEKSVQSRSATTKSTQHLQYGIIVHERPQAKFSGCDPQRPLMVAKGRAGSLPIEISRDVDSPPYSLRYAFTPRDALKTAMEHGLNAEVKHVVMKSTAEQVVVKDPGLYTLMSISSRFCTGDILESSDCLFLTPPEPGLSIAFDEIVDKCAGSSIGLTIDLTLVGTPPFVVYYRKIKDKREIQVKSVRVVGTRHQLRLTPSDAGHYTYEFISLDDAVYSNLPLDSRELRAEQRVIPLAGAAIVASPTPQKRCIEESARVDVRLQGSGPWQLNYELIHAGKRVKYTDENITQSLHTILTPRLVDGGEYTLALATVEDSHGCKIFLESEAHIDVRRQRPKASFADIDGQAKVKALQGELVRIPLRLVGEKPFTVKVKHLNSPSTSSTLELVARDFNAYLEVRKQGRYEIVEVRDSICPGTVGSKSGIFEVEWIPKPSIRISDAIANIEVSGRTVRKSVCEGDEDAVEIEFSGTSPYLATFERVFQGLKSDQRSLHPFDLKAGTNIANIHMDTAQPGTYLYNFLTLADGLYDKPEPLPHRLSLEQHVHPRPTARFVHPGKVYKYCLEAGTGDDMISIMLEGEPPFSLDISIKHYTSGLSEIIHVANIETKTYNFRVPSHALTLGGHSIRLDKIRDNRNCARKMNAVGPHVTVAVADLPSIVELDNKPYYCVGDRISFSLAGVPPFTVEYQFEGKTERANTPATFQRIAERPGNLTLTALRDAASECKVPLALTKMIYGIPSVRVSEGDSVVEGIHEGEQARINFTLYGTPPFTFTYTRSEISTKGGKPKVLEMHTETTHSYLHTIFASQEGTYEVISIQDSFCGYSSRVHVEDAGKLLKYT